MDFVYPYDGRDAKGIGIDLSIQSMRKFYRGDFRQVWLIGPVESVEGAHVIAVADDTGDRYANVIRKIATAAGDDRISDPFIVLSDDVIATRPFDDPPFYRSGDCADHAGSLKHGESVRRTGEWLSDHGFATDDFETHTPRVLRKSRVQQTLAACPWREERLQFFTLYGNMHGASWQNGRDAKRLQPGQDAGHGFVSFPCAVDKETKARIREMINADHQTDT